MAPSGSRMRANGCGQIALRPAVHRRLQIDALIPIGGSLSRRGRFVDRFATILWRLIAGGGALRTASPGAALLGSRRGPMDRAAGNRTGPGSKTSKFSARSIRHCETRRRTLKPFRWLHSQGDISVGSVASDLSYPPVANFDLARNEQQDRKLGRETGKISDSGLAMNLQ
jgi:hypothetical protein